MSTLAISPIPAINVANPSSQQAIVNSLNVQHQQSIHNENQNADQASLNSDNAVISADAASQNATALNSNEDASPQTSPDPTLTDGNDAAVQGQPDQTQTLTTAAAVPDDTGALDSYQPSDSSIDDPSLAQAESPYTAYRYESVAPAVTTPAVTGTAPETIAEGLIRSQIQTNLEASRAGAQAVLGINSRTTDASGNTANTVLGILNAAYAPVEAAAAQTAVTAPANPNATDTSLTAGPATRSTTLNLSTPYDTLVSAIGANLTLEANVIAPALRNLQTTGNFINTTA